MTTPERRNFSVDTHLIVNLIKHQAGTREKALLENVMNSIDAQATSVDVTITAEGYVMRDDGHGFQTMDDIQQYFEQFAFNHDTDPLQARRTYGKFGIGRAQQWNYARCTYRSRTFQMDMDMNARGVNYILTRELPDQPGTVITGEWYEPLTSLELHDLISALRLMVKYAPRQINVNGVQANVDPASEKWTVITDDAYIRLNRSSHMQVYNLGVLVAELKHTDVWSGGVTVSRRQLPLNMARNEVESTDPAYRRILMAIKQSAQTRGAARHTESGLTIQAQQAIHNPAALSEEEAEQIKLLKLVRDVQDKKYTIEETLKLIAYRPVIPYDRAHANASVYVHEQELAFTVAATTMTRFNVETVEELVDGLYAFAELYCPAAVRVARRDVRTFRSVHEFAPDLGGLHRPKPLETLSAKEQAQLRGLNHPQLQDWIGGYEIQVGLSDTQSYWVDTDARTVFMNERVLSGALGDPHLFMNSLYQVIMTYRVATETGGTLEGDALDQQSHRLIQELPLYSMTRRLIHGYVTALRDAKLPVTKRLSELLNGIEKTAVQIGMQQDQTKKETPVLN